MSLVLCTLLDKLGLAAPFSILFVSIGGCECLFNFVENRSDFFLMNLLQGCSWHVGWLFCAISIYGSFLLMSLGAVFEIKIIVFLPPLSTLLWYCIGIAPLNQFIFSLRLILLKWASFNDIGLWTLLQVRILATFADRSTLLPRKRHTSSCFCSFIIVGAGHHTFEKPIKQRIHHFALYLSPI